MNNYSNWNSSKMGDVVNLAQGLAINKNTQHLIVDENGLPLLRIKDLFENSHEILINSDGAPKQSVVNPEDILFTRTGQVGYVFTGRSGVLHNNCFKIIPKKNLTRGFIYWYLKQNNVIEYLQNLASGAAQPDLGHKAFKSLEIRYPSEDIQQKISETLFLFENLIKINESRINTLEQMAQLLYREWFVEFRFPGYEKCKFVNSELGKIPDSWIISSLNEHIKLDKGVSYDGEGLTEEGNPMVNLKSISVDGRYVRGSDKPYSGDYKSRNVINPGDIVLANTDMTQNGNVVGRAAIVPALESDKEIIFSHHIFGVRIKNSSSLKRNYLLNLLNSYYFHGHAKGYAVGTTVLGLSADSVYRFKFPLPSKETSDLFEANTKGIYVLIENLENQNVTLAKTRDLMLPKLMSGEIDVSKLDINVN